MLNLSIKETSRMVELRQKFEKGLETSLEEFKELRDLEFKDHMLAINFRLPKNEKYYYASHCHKFTQNLYKKADEKLKKRIIEQGITFNPHSINIGYNQYCEDYKRFNSKEELLGFVVGFNNACDLD